MQYGFCNKETEVPVSLIEGLTSSSVSSQKSHFHGKQTSCGTFTLDNRNHRVEGSTRGDGLRALFLLESLCSQQC